MGVVEILDQYVQTALRSLVGKGCYATNSFRVQTIDIGCFCICRKKSWYKEQTGPALALHERERPFFSSRLWARHKINPGNGTGVFKTKAV